MGMLLDLQLNQRAYLVSVVATIFVPLTFITGFFAMNFGWMVDRVDGPAASCCSGFSSRRRWPGGSSCAGSSAARHRAGGAAERVQASAAAGHRPPP